MIARPLPRVVYVALAIGTIALGLWIHWGVATLSTATRDMLGDAIWAGMIAWWVGAVAPRAPLLPRAASAFGICAAVELSQLIHAPVIDAVRSTTLGGLVLGSGFDPRDLAAYAIGVAAATLLEWTFAGVFRVSRP